mgnify:CR=1 FL=1
MKTILGARLNNIGMDLFPKEYAKKEYSAKNFSTAGGASFTLTTLGQKIKSGFSGGRNFLASTGDFWQNLAKYLTTASALILILLVLAWGGLLIYEKVLNNKTAELKQTYSKIFNEQDRTDATQIIEFDKTADFLQALLKKHVYSTSLLSQLATSTLPQVQWVSFNLLVKENRIATKGRAANYQTLAKQYLALEKGGFSEIELSSIALNRVGGVDFEASFNFDSKYLTEAN